MLSPFMRNTKVFETRPRNSYLKCICSFDEKLDLEKENKFKLNISNEKNYNNHVFYCTNDNNRNRIHNLSETLNDLYNICLCGKNSINNIKEIKTIKNKILDNKINSNKYQNIKDNCHSYENIKENEHNMKNNKRDKEKNNYNLKYLKIANEETNSQRINSKNLYFSNNFKNDKKNNKDNLTKNDLSKVIKNNQKRNNYGYKEIKDMKIKKVHDIDNNKNQILLHNYTYSQKELKEEILQNFNDNNQCKLRNSLNLNNNKAFINNQNKFNNNYYKDSSKNQNDNKFHNFNSDEKKKSTNPDKNNFFILANSSSYKNINILKGKEKENPKNPKLIKAYINSTPENKNRIRKKPLVNYIKRNENNQIHNNYSKDNEIKKENISRYNTNEFKYTFTNIKTLKNFNQNNNYDKKIKNSIYSNVKHKIEKVSPNKLNSSNVFNHEKQKSFVNNSIINTEKNIYSNRKEKYDLNRVNKINITSKKPIPIINDIIENKSTMKTEGNDIKSIYRKRQVITKFEKSVLINKNKNHINTIIENKENNNLNYKYIQNKDINISSLTNVTKAENKELYKKFTTNKYETSKNFYNNKLNIKDLNKNNKNKKSKEKTKRKVIVLKQSKSQERKDKKEKINKKFSNKNRIIKTKTKSKSKAKKHSKCIKYLDNLKIFKFSETSYNINNESSTNYTKSNINENKYRKYILKTARNTSKKKKNINSFNLQYKTYEEDFRINKIKINDSCKYLKPQNSCRITLSKNNNVKIKGIKRYFKVNYYCSENLKCEYDIDSEDTSEYYNNKF